MKGSKRIKARVVTIAEDETNGVGADGADFEDLDPFEVAGKKRVGWRSVAPLCG
jgi:hypothetical protein